METKNGYVVALGTFDGLHLGHKAVLTAALRFKNLIPVAVTFDEPPKRHTSGAFIPMLMSANRKNCLLKELGFAKIDVLDYNEVHDIKAEEFLKILFEKYDIKAVVCGFNYRFGENGSGDAALLSSFCHERNAEIVICPATDVGGQTISSTLIRGLISDGSVDFASTLMHEPFSFESEVLHGEQRGRQMGFPTINQPLDENLVTPKFGVYASVAVVNGKEYPAVTNIGIRPTFILKKPQSETYIIGFSGDLYGKKVTIKLLKYLRPETRFTGLNELVTAIEGNAAEATALFSDYKKETQTII